MCGGKRGMVGRVPVSTRRSAVWRHPRRWKSSSADPVKRANTPDLQIGPGCYASNGKDFARRTTAAGYSRRHSWRKVRLCRDFAGGHATPAVFVDFDSGRSLQQLRNKPQKYLRDAEPRRGGDVDAPTGRLHTPLPRPPGATSVGVVADFSGYAQFFCRGSSRNKKPGGCRVFRI